MDGARVVVEKPFGRDLASAQELNRAARARNYVASVQITLAEKFGVDGRGAFYEMGYAVSSTDRSKATRHARCWLRVRAAPTM